MTASRTPIGPAEALRAGAAAGTWMLDPKASRIAVAVKHFWGLITVRGTFASASGQAEVGVDGTIVASLDVDAASIETKNRMRDKHLRSDDFFDVERHPKITFTTGDVTIVDEETVRVAGVVTAAGVDQATAFDAVLVADGDRATVTAEAVVDHRALGMTWSPMGMAKPTALVSLDLTFTRGAR